MKNYKIGYGIISRNLTSTKPFIRFLNNAKKYNHKIEKMIFCIKDKVDSRTVEQLKEYTDIDIIRLDNKIPLQRKFNAIGLPEHDINNLLATPYLKSFDMVSYGKARNYVLMEAILQDFDFLLFFDTDVKPEILFKNKKSDGFHPEEIDFVGSHLNILSENYNIAVTTSDYSGYYIIPKMEFAHVKDLLFGLQKEDAYKIVIRKNKLVIKYHHNYNVRQTKKILGGNVAIDLRHIEFLPPFFSATLVMDNECFLGRGEDTLFGPLIAKAGGKCLDIDLLIFHDTFGDFPRKPDIHIEKNIERFFYACMGWIIRNPFYNWLHEEYIGDFNKINVKERYKSLQIGSKFAARFLDDDRFLKLPEAFLKSYENLENVKKEFFELLESWEKFKKIKKSKE